MTIYKSYLTIPIYLFCFLIFYSCNRDDDNCVDSQGFCSFINEENYDKTLPIIDDYLKGLKSDDADENLEILKDWLKCKSCIEKVEIKCNSCIKTSPPQTEIDIDFLVNEQVTMKTLDVVMRDPMKSGRYH